MREFEGKSVLVTGASSGIGAAVARAFGERGAHVGVHYHRGARPARAIAAAITKAGGQAVTIRADARDSGSMRAAVERTVEAFGRIDVLVNNAGALVRRVPIAEFDDANFDEILALNVRSALAATSAAVPHMRRQTGGSIIFVTSAAARHGGGPGATLYAGAKGFLNTVTHGLARELASDRIRVNAVSPGVIATPFHDKFTTAEQLATFRSGIPMGRLGTPNECVGAFLYLASDAASGYVTGQVLEVNGGQLMP
ncbi:MAG: SDR family NAD(P)-dependent oxidoreductase [Burkholderiaceae bacterium]